MTEHLQFILDSLKKQKYADARLTMFAVQAKLAGGAIHLEGEALSADQRAEAEQAAVQAAPGEQIINDITVLSRSDSQWGLVRRGLANLHRAPTHGSELLAQGLFGEPIELLTHNAEKGWWFVRIADGYLGWMEASALSRCDRNKAQSYRAQASALVLPELAATYSALLATGAAAPEGLRAGKLPFGTPVSVSERRHGMARVNWEGEPPLWIAEDDLLPMAQRPRPDAAGFAYTLDRLHRSIGVPYLWGGETPFGYDCSGLAQTALEFVGLAVPRDADLQFAAGQPVEGEPQPGDLLFFSSDPTIGLHAATPRLASITHVAISLGGDEFIHATGQVWGVTRNSLDPASPIYRAWLKEHLAGVRRFR